MTPDHDLDQHLLYVVTWCAFKWLCRCVRSNNAKIHICTVHASLSGAHHLLVSWYFSVRVIHCEPALHYCSCAKAKLVRIESLWEQHFVRCAVWITKHWYQGTLLTDPLLCIPPTWHISQCQRICYIVAYVLHWLRHLSLLCILWVCATCLHNFIIILELTVGLTRFPSVA